MTEAVYLRLPIPLKQAAVSFYGRKLEQQRYATTAQDEQVWGVPAVAGKSGPELEALQADRLAAVIRRAQALSPFWAERLAGLRISGAVDLNQAPALSKHELRAAGRDVVCRDIGPRELVREQTSGSTGTPLVYYLSTAAVRRNYAFYRSFRAWHGYQPGQRRARFGGRLILPYSQRRPPFWLFDPAQDTLYLSLLHMGEETLPEYARAVAEYGPVELSGYPSSLSLFAEWCLQHGEGRIRPQRVLTDAETLLEPQRETIEAAFGCRVTDCYGPSEMGMFAGQCEQGTYHVFPHLVVLEVLDDAGRRCREGEVGAIHVTSLANDAAPLIRYSTGDRGALGPAGCACGLQTPTLSAIEGRVDDVVTTADGRQIGRLDHIFKGGGSGEIRECQIVQLSPGRFRFLVVPGEQFDANTLERTRGEAQARLGADSELSFEVVSQIPRSPNGKFRAVVVSPPTPHPSLRLGMIEALYPRATGTFYQREIDGLAENGLEVQTFVLYPHDPAAWNDPAVLALTGGRPPDRSRVHYAAFLWSKTVLQANLRALTRKPARYLSTLGTLLQHLSQQPRVAAKMLAVFPKAVYFAAEADRMGVDHLCAFWANHCATAAYVMAALMDRPVHFSTYAHAGADLYRDQSFLREKLRAASAVFANCEFNRQWLAERYPEVAAKVQVHEVGLDLGEYCFDATPRTGNTLLAVGALFQPKGFHILVEACARLRERGVAFRCEILGEGPERADLEARVRRHGLQDLVSLPGQQPHGAVVERMRAARVLVHPSVGLGDAMPTVIKEAAALGTPVVATRAVGIPELVIEGESGLLVPENDSEALAAAIAETLANPVPAAQRAVAGRAHVERTMDRHENVRCLAEEFRRLVSLEQQTAEKEKVR
ncbi:MAG: glycosyltransferase [Dehalococcoidia bacterium]